MASQVPEDHRQREIARRLEFLGGAPSTYFRDACELMARRRELGSMTHLVSHLLREIEGALRGALGEMVPEAERPERETKNSHQRQIDLICDALGLPAEDGVRVSWRSLKDKLHAGAHRSGLAAPRPLDRAFEELWAEAQAVLDAVMRRVEASYAEQLPRVEALACGEPDLKRFRDAMLHSAVALDRFYELAGPKWLEPLRKAGYFAHPEPLERNEEGGFAFVRWPPGAYLVRMAAEAPESIVAVGRGLQTTNPEAQQSLVEAACRIEPAKAAQLLETFEAWLASTPVMWSLPYKARELVVRLLGAGLFPQALGLTGALLRSPAVAGEEGVAAEHLAWLVAEIFPAAGIGGLELAVEMLVAQLKAEGEGRAEYSSIWRPRIDAERLRGDRDTVVSAIRDAAEALAANDVPLAEILAALEAPELQIANRIALDLLTRRPNAALAETRLLDRELFEDASCRREVKGLAVAAFAELDSIARERLLGWIEESRPHPEEDERRRFWQLQMLAGLDPLPEGWAALRAERETEFGPLASEPPEFPRGGYIGDRSPLSEKELAEMEVGAVISYLASFTPGDTWEGPSREGLGRVLEEAIAADPGRFAPAATEFAELDPTYVRALLGGLREAIAKERPFDWGEPLELCRALTAKPRQGEDEDEGLAWDCGWSGAWRGSIDLILAALRSEHSPTTIESRAALFEVITFHLEIRDPYLEGEIEERDPASVAVGSTRCQALEAAIGLAALDHRTRPDGHLDPELAALLKRCLDSGSERSPAVWSVLGARFVNLVSIDELWALEHLEAIFPLESDPELWRAAWDGYVERNQAHPRLLEILERHYRRALEDLSDGTEEDRNHDPDEALVAQLVSFYLSGTVALAEPGGLFPRFYERASPERREQAISIVGRSLENFAPLRAEVEERLRALVEWRLSEGGDPQELEGYSWWFSSGEFEVEWSLDFLSRLLVAGGSLGPDHMVTERLAALSATHPLSCVEALRLLIEAGVRPWFVLGSEAEIETILGAALAAEGEAPSRARDLVNILVARGAVGFARLLPDWKG